MDKSPRCKRHASAARMAGAALAPVHAPALKLVASAAVNILRPTALMHCCMHAYAAHQWMSPPRSMEAKPARKGDALHSPADAPASRRDSLTGHTVRASLLEGHGCELTDEGDGRAGAA